MKSRFNTYDIICAVCELQSLVGLRVNQIYDIDNKTYLIRLQGGNSKTMLLIESGTRFHTTGFEWPKNLAPSGFSMKLRKHLKNKRLEKLQQIGVDRIVDFQFGTNEAAYHVIVELYDRGNIILTDHEFTILYILRPHYEGEEVRFVVREKYPLDRAKSSYDNLNEKNVKDAIISAAPGENLRRVLMPVADCGPAVLDHVLKKYELDKCIVKYLGSRDSDDISVQSNKKERKIKKKELGVEVREFDFEKDFSVLMKAIEDTQSMLLDANSNVAKGYIVQKQEAKPSSDEKPIEYFYQNVEYHPYLFLQFKYQPVAEFSSFMLAVDEFYSKLEGQKIDLRTIQQEREALKKLSNVKSDHAKRLEELAKSQGSDILKAELITSNQKLVDNAILAIRSAIANQMSWPDIQELVKAAQTKGDPVAVTIQRLKLEVNHISLCLSDPYGLPDNDNSSQCKKSNNQKLLVDVDLGLSAWANARKYYDHKRSAAQKEQKTIAASQKALKSAERKTQQTLKDVRTISTIHKARKVYWFEKFYWFISSENYLVIGGRDAQQNELIVKRYMRPNDIYVHAEIQGASSVVIRNPSSNEVPPKTLLEAGTMAISYSVAWDAKVVTNAYWVHSDQVSKTAPSGEYLGTGSFMVRGKKNFLPPCHLIMGLSLLFKLEESFVEKHRGERMARTIEEEQQEIATTSMIDMLKEKEDEANEINEDKREHIDFIGEIMQENESKVEGGKDKIANLLIFPDTEVKVEHDTGRITVRTDSVKEDLSDIDEIILKNGFSAEDTTIISAAPSRKKLQQNAKKRKEEKLRKIISVQEQQQQNKTADISNLKRGQKGKLKKIKMKYKDQDDEERELRMQILKSSGKDKNLLNQTIITEHIEPVQVKPNKGQSQTKENQNQLDIDDNEDLLANVDTDLIDSLTGQPHEDDEVLFVIPVVAPYQALQHYKFKVKLTPGTGKRGRAAKTALAMFAKDKSIAPREKDLLKSIKEEALARNIPGKVKISAPQLQRLKL